VETDGSSSALVRRAWLVAVGREPTLAEKALAEEFLAAQRSQYAGADGSARALADLCQMLLASNAFLYLE
jgi:hypothetical protein